MVEIWKPVIGFEGLYEVSSIGRVKSIPRKKSKGGLLKQYVDRYGYLKVILYKNGNPHYFTVHRLVAIAFILNPQNKTAVDHIDCDRKNNQVENLRWVTTKENLDHSHELGRQIINATPVIAISPNGEKKIFSSQREAERKTGVKQYAISRTLHNKKANVKGWVFSYD